MFNWDDLRYFAAFARLGSFAAAARELRVEHATVARRIVALEQALDMVLLDRRGRLHVLTSQGQRLAGMATSMADAAYGVERFAGHVAGKVQGEVTVSAPPAFLATIVAPHVWRMTERYPDLTLRLVGAKDDASLSRKEADIALRLSRPSHADVVVRRLGSMHFRFYAQPAYAAATPEADYGFVRYDASLSRSPQEQWLDASLAGRRIVLRSNDLRIQAEAAASGAGVVLLPTFLAAQYSLVPLGFALPLMREIWLAYHVDLRRAPAVQAAADFLIECVSSHEEV